MERARYTNEQLLHIRQSPLVRKPDELPSIDEWIESSQPAQQDQPNGGRKSRTPSQRPEDPSPMGNFSSQRPSLLQTRHTSRSAQQPDDIVLGPPKLSFTSSRNVPKVDKTEDREQEDSGPTNARSRFFRDRENNKNGGGKDWRSSRAQEDEDAPADAKYPIRQPRETGGFGQRLDQRWSRDGERDRSDRPAQRGGWREREKMRTTTERHDVSEKDPEWMDEPVEKNDKSDKGMNQMRTQEDFERWKERMKAGNNASAEVKEETPLPEFATPVKTMTPAPSKPQTPLVTGGASFDGLFGSWAETKRIESPVDTRAAKAPLPGGKGKSSRFASMFAPREEPRMAAPEESSASPAPAAAPLSLPGFGHAANGSSEDKEGFARIMAMLGGNTRLSDSPAEQQQQQQDGSRPPGYNVPPQDALSAMFNKTPAPAQSRPQSGFGGEGFMPPPPPPPPSHLSHPASNVASPNPQSRRPDPASQLPQQMQSIFLDQSSRTASTPASPHPQQSRKPNSLNKDSEFLLNLIQTKNANRAPPPNRPQNEPDNFQLFLDQPPKPHAPKTQSQHRPSESVEEQLFRQNQQLANMEQARRRAPPGFIEDPSILAQQAQRSYPPEQAQPRRQSTINNHMPGSGPNNNNNMNQNNMPPTGPGAPQDFPPPNFPFMSGPPPPNVVDRMPPPPPGFNPNMRHPPGFASMPSIFQQPNSSQHPHQQPPPPQQMGPMSNNMPPPGFPGMPPPPLPHMQGPPPPGFFNGPPGHAGGPGIPPGFAPPPGMMMMMGGQQGGVRSPADGGNPGMRSPQEGPMGIPMLQGYGRR